MEMFAAQGSAVSFLDKNDLTDNEIHQLLVEAEGRLTSSKSHADSSRWVYISVPF